MKKIRNKKSTSRWITSEYAKEVCLQAGFRVFKARKEIKWSRDVSTYTWGYVVEATKSQLDELGLINNGTTNMWDRYTQKGLEVTK